MCSPPSGAARGTGSIRASRADTGVGEAFLVDTSRTDYWVDFDPRHLQVNVTLLHELLARLYERWFGELPSASLQGYRRSWKV